MIREADWLAKIDLGVHFCAEYLLWRVLFGPKVLGGRKLRRLQLLELLLGGQFQLVVVERVLHVRLL